MDKHEVGVLYDMLFRFYEEHDVEVSPKEKQAIIITRGVIIDYFTHMEE